MAEDKKQSCTQGRRVVAYPPEPIYNMLRAYPTLTDESVSSFVNEAIKEKINRLPEGIREQLKRQSKHNY